MNYLFATSFQDYVHLCLSNKSIHMCYIFKTKEIGNISLQLIKKYKNYNVGTVVTDLL